MRLRRLTICGNLKMLSQTARLSGVTLLPMMSISMTGRWLLGVELGGWKWPGSWCNLQVSGESSAHRFPIMDMICLHSLQHILDNHDTILIVLNIKRAMKWRQLFSKPNMSV